jgi:hypothetical protein
MPPHIAQFLGNNIFKASLLPSKLVQVFKMKKLHQIVKLIFKKKLEKRMQQLVARS